MYCLRVKLANFESSVSPKASQKRNKDFFQSPLTNTEGYEHKSSESRAFKRVNETLPQTPAKKVWIVEKIHVVTNTTPRSRKALTESPSIQAVFLGRKSKCKLTTQYSIIETVKHNMLQRNKRQLQPVRLIANKLLKNSCAMSSAARELGIERKTLSRCINSEKRPRKIRKDKAIDDHVTTGQNFYLEEASRQMPNKRDVLLISDKSGKRVPVQTHLMEMTQEDAYKKFRERETEIWSSQASQCAQN